MWGSRSASLDPAALGIADLGGSPVILDTAMTQGGRGEMIADTARVLGSMTSAIVWRTYAQSGLEEMAAHADDLEAWKATSSECAGPGARGGPDQRR